MTSEWEEWTPEPQPPTGGEADSVSIRRARPWDVPAIVELWHELQFANAGWDRRLAVGAPGARWFENYIAEQIVIDSALVLVAEHEGCVIGYVLGLLMERPTLIESDCGLVGDLIVTADHRMRGVGKRLFLEARRWFALRGIENLEVQVVRANPAAQAFWRKMGFCEFLRTLRMDQEAGKAG
ncbi:MAG: N-acetyltransferase family protein [Capsulimonadaceae bacterium]